jgi:chain length determinant protein EpsF
MTFNHLMLILRSRWKLAFTMFFGVVLLAIAYCLFAPKQYTAISSVVIDTKSDPVAPVGLTEQLMTSYVNTQTDVIASERVALRAVKALRLDLNPDLQRAWHGATDGQGDITLWIADYLIDRKVTVGPGKTKNGNVINIAVKWPDPKMAADIANAFAQAAIDTNIELKIEPAKQFAKWFDKNSTTLRASLAEKQKRLSDFENANGIVATDEKLDVENARLAELSSQLVDIQTQRQDSQSRQRQVSADNASLPEVLQSPVIAKLKSDLSDAEARESDVASRLGKNHPDYQAAVAEVSNLHERIQQEADKIAGGLGSNMQINLRREAEIRVALEDQKKRVLELKHKHDQATILQSDVATAQRDLDAVTERLAQSNLESQEHQTNMVALSTAMVPFKPSSPKLVLGLLAGVLVGTVLGIGAALFAERRDQRVREEGELPEMLQVPLLVSIGTIKVKKLRRSAVAQLPRMESSGI